MSDKIEPALTPEEWKRLRPARPEALDTYDLGLVPALHTNKDGFYLSTFVPRRVADGDWVEVDRPTAIIAILNAALPDDDPRKITREDVALLRETAETVRIHGEYNDDVFDDDEREPLYRLAAKLTALLPPDDVNA